MENNYVLIILLLPVAFFFAKLTYQIFHLFYLWIKFKFENIKIKEYQLWD
tara:strand:+ start:254 stop:403 length:150 start_codon:yes stop_codon:yes gene_type:complete